MPDTKISALPSGSPAVGTDLIPIARSGATKQVPLSDVAALSGYAYSSKTANFTAVASNWYGLETNALTATLPATPATGDRLRLHAGTSSITSVTLGRNGSNINSAAADLTVSNFWIIDAIYEGATIGWRVMWSPMVTEATWTPTDGSGAGLALTVTTAIYTRIGRTVTVEFQGVYPTTASGATAQINGLPFAANGKHYALFFNSTGVGSGIAVSVASGATSVTFTTNVAAAVTNANLSTLTVGFTLIYQI